MTGQEVKHIEKHIGALCQCEYRIDYVSSFDEYKVQQSRRYLTRKKYVCSPIYRRADDGRYYITII